MANAPFLSCAQARAEQRLLHHEQHTLLEGQCRTVKSFERERFEQLGALDDEPCTRFGRQIQAAVDRPRPVPRSSLSNRCSPCHCG